MNNEAKVINITSEKQLKDLLPGKKVVVDFYATWCGPCRRMAEPFANLAAKHANLTFCRLDVDEFQEYCMTMEINSLPTFAFFNDGKVVDKMLGADVNGLENKVSTFAA